MSEEKQSIYTRIRLIWKSFWSRHRFKIIIGTLILSFFVVYLWRNIFISIGTGHAGVLWKRFSGGTVTDKVYGEGLHIIFPWDVMADYDVRIQERNESVKVLTSMGLYVSMDISFRFYPERNTLLPLLHQEWGPRYAEKFVVPESKAAAIAVLGEYKPEDLFSLDTTEIQRKIKKKLDTEFRKSHIILHDFLISRLALPKTISDAIERKLEKEQLLQEYKFRLQVEEKEKERKEIEAQGIRLFEQISGIPILKWQGLTVTSEIARSNNAKVIVIGTGAGGLPIILNADK
ncbi:MAG: prohibitin family protein [bacterium]|nr:prohibitin family protein [bacterium]